MAAGLRSLIAPLAGTPLHPQWLIRGRAATRRNLRAVTGGTVLDVGCADQWARDALPSSCTYVGLDHPPTADRRYRTRPDVFADASRLPLRDSCVDCVLLLEVLEHLPEPAAALREIRRVLRPGGQLVLSVPFIYPLHDAPFDFQRYTEYGLRRALADAGFGGIEITPSSGTFETAGLTACLALAGSAMNATRDGGFKLLALPVVAVLVPVCNLVAWAMERLMPGWSGMTAGHDVRATRA